jgi:hypothetical protein
VLLSTEEVSRYNEQGFLLRAGGGIPVLTPGEVDIHRRVWQEIFDAHCDGDPQGVNGFFKRYGGAYDLVSHPGIVQLAKDILGPRCCCWGAHCAFLRLRPHIARPCAYTLCLLVLYPAGMDASTDMCKPSGDRTATPLGFSEDGSPAHHQDGLGWPFRPLASTTVWLALDDVSVENGAMVVYPGSHRLGVVDCRTQRVVEEQCGPGVALSPVVAGSASLHCDLVVHSSPPSTSKHSRRLAVGIEFVSMEHCSDCGSGWGAACFVPDGDLTEEERKKGFGHIPRPAMFSPLLVDSAPPAERDSLITAAAAAAAKTGSGRL